MLVVRSVFSAISLILGNATQCGRLRSARPEARTHLGVGADEIHLPRGLGNYPDCPDFISDVSVHSLPHRVQDDPGQTDFQKCLVSSCTSQTHVLKKLLGECVQSRKVSQERGRLGVSATLPLAGMGYRGSQMGLWIPRHQQTCSVGWDLGEDMPALPSESWTSSCYI